MNDRPGELPLVFLFKAVPVRFDLARSLEMQAATSSDLGPLLGTGGFGALLGIRVVEREHEHRVALGQHLVRGAARFGPVFPFGERRGGRLFRLGGGASPVALASVAVAEGCPPSPEISAVAVAGGAAGAEPPPQATRESITPAANPILFSDSAFMGLVWIR